MNGDSIFVNPKLGIASEAKDPVIAILLAQFHHLDKTEFLSECIAENISSKECNISFVKALNLFYLQSKRYGLWKFLRIELIVK